MSPLVEPFSSLLPNNLYQGSDMTFDPNIPQPTDLISSSAVPIQTNFSQLNTIFDFNHFTWDDATAANRGLHRKIDFPTPTTVAAPTGNDSVLYPKTVAGVTQLFFDNATVSAQITGGAFTSAQNGGIDFPQGVKFRWGAVTFTGTSQVFTFDTTFASTFVVVITPINVAAVNGGLRVSTQTAANFTVTASSSVTNASLYYIAIGN